MADMLKPRPRQIAETSTVLLITFSQQNGYPLFVERLAALKRSNIRACCKYMNIHYKQCTKNHAVEPLTRHRMIHAFTAIEACGCITYVTADWRTSHGHTSHTPNSLVYSTH